jgi:hypothetical protein
MRALTRSGRMRDLLRALVQDEGVRVSFVDESINPRPIPFELVRRSDTRLGVARDALRVGDCFRRAMQATLGDAAISFRVSELPLRFLVFTTAQVARRLRAKSKGGHVRRLAPAPDRAPRDRRERR